MVLLLKGVFEFDEVCLFGFPFLELLETNTVAKLEKSQQKLEECFANRPNMWHNNLNAPPSRFPLFSLAPSSQATALPEAGVGSHSV